MNPADKYRVWSACLRKRLAQLPFLRTSILRNGLTKSADGTVATVATLTVNHDVSSQGRGLTFVRVPGHQRSGMTRAGHDGIGCPSCDGLSGRALQDSCGHLDVVLAQRLLCQSQRSRCP
jgi:hypothetical protein